MSTPCFRVARRPDRHKALAAGPACRIERLARRVVGVSAGPSSCRRRRAREAQMLGARAIAPPGRWRDLIGRMWRSRDRGSSHPSRASGSRRGRPRAGARQRREDDRPTSFLGIGRRATRAAPRLSGGQRGIISSVPAPEPGIPGAGVALGREAGTGEHHRCGSHDDCHALRPPPRHPSSGTST
jgi:hypothetical protein